MNQMLRRDPIIAREFSQFHKCYDFRLQTDQK